MGLQAYLNAYKENFPFTLSEQFSYGLYDIRVAVDVYEYSDDTTYRETACLRMEKDGFRYECDCIDEHDWQTLLFPVTVAGRELLLFRKSLYGFTLLDPETLTEAFDYFPEKVLRGEESFIITSALTFGKYLIFDGCYWGCPYEFCAYDPAQRCFASLTNAYGIRAGDHTAKALGDTLILKGDDMDWNPAEIMLTEANLDRLMNEQGTTDF